MGNSLFLKVDAWIICLTLLVLMPLIVKWGNGMRKKFWGPEDTDTRGGINSLMGALFGLWGFMLAFSFGQSGVRFENLRSMIVDESNDLRNAILRTDFFPDSIRNVYRVELRKYLEERIAYYDNGGGDLTPGKSKETLPSTTDQLWALTVTLSKRPDTHNPADDMTGALIRLFDISAKREALLNAGIPSPVSIALILLVLSICFVGGFTTPVIQKKEWIVVCVFSFLAAMILYITIDLARPMEGLIRPDAGEAGIVGLRRLF